MQVESDLHLEFVKPLDEAGLAKFMPRKQGAHCLFLAGDICSLEDRFLDRYERLIKYAAQTWSVVFVITGNHEYYHGEDGEPLTVEECDALARSICEQFSNVHFLQRESYYMAEYNLTVLGVTLWSNTDRRIELNDYNNIYKAVDGKHVNITYKDTQAWWQRDAKWLEDTINEERTKGRQILCLTHHMPSFKLIAKQYKFSPANIGFASHMDHLFKLCQYWFCGHTHLPTTIRLEGCQIVINPRGYPGETQYKPIVLPLEATPLDVMRF